LEQHRSHFGQLLMRYVFTTRHDGNMGLHVGDIPLHVHQNRERLAQKVGLKLLFMNQVHGDRVEIVDEHTGVLSCDAMISQAKGVGLCVMGADCIPLLFYDAPTQSIGVAHAGRAGSVAHLSTKTVRAMQESFGVRPETLHVYIGPSIKVCCYEVGIEATVGLQSVVEEKDGRYFLDLQRANYNELLSLGLTSEHIFDAGVCTCCDERYFSYRRETVTGRCVGVIGL